MVVEILKSLLILFNLFFLGIFISWTNSKEPGFLKLVLGIATSFIFTSTLSFFLYLSNVFSFQLLNVITLFLNISCVVLKLIKDVRIKKLRYIENTSKLKVRRLPLFFLSLIILIYLLLVSPIPNLTGRRDTGVYLNTAILLQSSKSLQINYKFQNNYPDNIFPDNEFFLAFFSKNNKIIPGHLHLFQVLLSLSINFLGNNFYYLNLIVGTITALTFYLVARQHYRNRYSLIATALFCINPLFIFFSEYNSPEMMFVMVLLMSIYFFRKSKDISMSLLLILFFLKVEAIFFIPFILFLKIREQKTKSMVWSITHNILLITIYYYYSNIVDIYNKTQISSTIQVGIIPFEFQIKDAIMVFILLFNLAGLLSSRFSYLWKKIFKLVNLLNLSAWIIYFVFWLINPLHKISGYGINNLKFLSWYINPILLFFGFYSIIFAFKKTELKILFFPITFLTLNYIMNAPVQPWGMRRYFISFYVYIFLSFAHFIKRVKISLQLENFIILSILIISIMSSLLYSKKQYTNIQSIVDDVSTEFTDQDIIFSDLEFSDVDIGINLYSSKNLNVIPVRNIEIREKVDLYKKYIENNGSKKMYYITYKNNNFQNYGIEIEKIKRKYYTVCSQEWEYDVYHKTVDCREIFIDISIITN